MMNLLVGGDDATQPQRSRWIDPILTQASEGNSSILKLLDQVSSLKD